MGAKAKLEVEAVQTVTPGKPAGSRSPRRVAAGPAALAEAMQSRVCVVLVYRRPLADVTGWNLAGRLKESLNSALPEQPVLAGRLRRADSGVGVEVRMTDSGARLVQVRAAAPMDLFVRSDDLVRHLAFWGDVEEKCFEYSPLLYVQLTVFEGEGYTIGVTGSLLATDPRHLSAFLHTWSKVHGTMSFSHNCIFHLGKFRRPSSAATPHHLMAVPCGKHRRTIFLTSPDQPPLPSTLFVNDLSGDLRITPSCEETQAAVLPEEDDGAEEVNWVEHVGLDVVGFEEGLLPAQAFCFLQSAAARGLTVLMPGHDGSAGAAVTAAAVLLA